jgi:hypothetical protein
MYLKIIVDTIEWPNRNEETIVWWMELLTECLDSCVHLAK